MEGMDGGTEWKEWMEGLDGENASNCIPNEQTFLLDTIT